MNSPTEAQAFKLRPRFVIHSQLSISEIGERFKASYTGVNKSFSGKVRTGYVSIYPLDEDRHYWSPHFSLSMEQSEDDEYKTLISVLYGPAPEVWTMFVFFYAIIGLLIVIATVIGFANKSIGESGAILWAVPFLLIVLASMYAVSYYGQKKGHDQVEGIYKFMLGVLNNEEE